MKIKILELKNEPDNRGDIMSPDAIVNFPSTIPLVQNFSLKEMLGTASLIREGNCFFIDNIKPFPFVRELKGPIVDYDQFLQFIGKTIPAIGGKVLEREGNVIKKFSIDKVSLSISKNDNPGIKTIEEQLE